MSSSNISPNNGVVVSSSGFKWIKAKDREILLNEVDFLVGGKMCALHYAYCDVI